MVTFPEVPLGIFLFCMCVIAIGAVQVGRPRCPPLRACVSLRSPRPEAGAACGLPESCGDGCVVGRRRGRAGWAGRGPLPCSAARSPAGAHRGVRVPLPAPPEPPDRGLRAPGRVPEARLAHRAPRPRAVFGRCWLLAVLLSGGEWAAEGGVFHINGSQLGSCCAWPPAPSVVFQGSSRGSLSGFPSSGSPSRTPCGRWHRRALLRWQCSLTHRCSPRGGVTHLFPSTRRGSLTVGLPRGPDLRCVSCSRTC